MSEREEQTKEYDVKVKWIEGKSGEVLVEEMPKIRTGKVSEDSKQFHTPEHLFVASATVCYMNSFVYFTEKMRLEFISFETDAVGTLDKVGRSFEITKIHTKTKLVIEDEKLKNRFERALELGAKYCFVANSMKCPVTHEHEILVR
ncbi:MAG: hypothetical protein BAJATHORv1_20660 [Candidatus Thorarchaeota archaeon]|nr:MAG: hypothetical protein BAJATHORv1_20660 [Candidatus Thorarchaeota archaeon]